MVTARAALAAALASLLAACTAVLGMEKLSERAASTDSGATTDAETGATACTDDVIDAAPRPAAQGTGDETRYFALNQLDIATSVDLGFDLDHVTTIDGPTTSCTFPQGVAPITDTPQGVDNAGASLFPTVGIVAPALSAKAINDRLLDGQFGLTLGLGGWNGTLTDDSLTLLVFPTLGIWTDNPGTPSIPGGPTNPSRRTISAGGATTDRWMRDARFAFSSAGTATAAWVDRGRLVARFDTLTLPIRSDLDLKLIDIVLHDAWITADLGGDKDQPTLKNGVIAGRAVVSEFVTGLLLLYTGQVYLCHQGQAPELARSRVCSFRDIRLSHCDDGKSLPCDALSFGAHFETYRVDQLGPTFEQTPDVYKAAGLLPPSERCSDVDIDGGSRCPP